ncbi:MAG: hypothetical protein ACERLG_00890 [Sedimentibacter sp.]
MKIKVSLIILASLFLVFIVSGCSADSNTKDELETKNNVIASLEVEKQTLEDKVTELEGKISGLEEEPETIPSLQNNMLSTALEVVQLLSDGDMAGVSTYVHPTAGLRFSPYDYVDISADQVFTAAQVAGLMNDTQMYTWGNYDGSGEPINQNFADYFQEFVYDEDYENPNMIGNNVLSGQGNIINNITDVYPNGVFADFHFTGFDPQYEGLDWSSLRLVFEEDNGTWYLVGIIHGQWTI